jgi:hypothetical protein
MMELQDKKEFPLLAILSVLLLTFVDGTHAGAEDSVPFEVIQRIALDNAASLWGDVYGTEAIPYYGLDDEIIAYMFNFSIGREFPPPDQVIERSEKARRESNDEERWGVDRYCHLIVSASYSMPPIPAYSKCLSEEFACDQQLRQMAKNALGTPAAQLVKIYYIIPSQKWYAYSDGQKEVYVRVFPPPTVYSEDEFTRKVKEVVGPSRKGDFRLLWQEFESGKKLSLKANHYIPMQEECPYYDWSYGCSPTAAAMLLAYWDNYSLYSPDNYANLVDYHLQRWDSVEEETDYQVPNLQLQLALAMSTDTLSGSTSRDNIAPGYVHCANFINGYGFSSWRVHGSYTQLFDTLTQHIDAGRPIHASVDIPTGHSVCVVGYTDDDYIIAHDTWHPPNHNWYFDVLANVYPVIPGLAYGYAVKLTSPVGDTLYNHDGNGEVWYAGNTYEITWNRDTSSDSVMISLSTGGGRSGTWAVIEDSTANDGSWLWTIPLGMSTTQARISVDLRDGGGSVLGGDGSLGNFMIRAIPVITVTPSSFDTTLIQGATAATTMTIANVGGDTLRFTVTDASGQSFKGMQKMEPAASDRINRGPLDLGKVPNVEANVCAHSQSSVHLSSEPSNTHSSLYAKRADWLSVYPDAGSIPPGGNMDITVEFDATSLGPHDYDASINILSNDPENPMKAVPVNLAVVGHDTMYISAGWTSTLPVIDGAIDSAEWASATRVDISDTLGQPDSPDPPGAVYLYLMNDEDRVYVAVDYPADATLDVGDEIAFYFDENNDDVWAVDSSEGNYWFSWYDTTSIIYRAVPSWHLVPAPTGVTGKMGSTPNLQLETSMPFGTEIYHVHAARGDTMGFLCYAFDFAPNEWGSWWQQTKPYSKWDEPAYYGRIVLAYYACGDCNGDGNVTFADALYLKNYYYQTPPGSPAPFGSADVNVDTRVTFADALYIKNYYYQTPPGSPAPCEPPKAAPFRERHMESWD